MPFRKLSDAKSTERVVELAAALYVDLIWLKNDNESLVWKKVFRLLISFALASAPVPQFVQPFRVGNNQQLVPPELPGAMLNICGGAVVAPAHVTVTGRTAPGPKAMICALVTVAASSVALTRVVAIGAPFQLMTQLSPKFVPVAVSSVSSGVADVGDRLANVAAPAGGAPPAGMMPKISGAVVKAVAPAAGHVTVTGTFVLGPPAAVIIAGLTIAVSCVALTRVVAIGVPFQLIVQPATKFVPVAMSETGPDVADVIGDRLVSVIVETLIFIAGVVKAVEPEPHVTVTGMFVPAPAVICAGVMAAVSCVALTTVVPVIAVPLQLIVQPVTKFVPVAVSKTGPDADAGARLARVAVAADEAGGVATGAATDGVVGAPWDGAGAFIRIVIP